MQAFVVHLFSGGNGGSETVTVDLGSARSFFAWCHIAEIDSMTDFDRDNAVAMDVFQIDGVRTTWRVSGGDHWGPSSSDSNVCEGAVAATGRRVTFRLRCAHKEDLHAYGTGIVLVP